MESTEKPPRSALEAYLAYQNRNSVPHTVESGPYCCPCCGFLTIAERGVSEIWPVAGGTLGLPAAEGEQPLWYNDAWAS
jgi:hypothetical protein